MSRAGLEYAASRALFDARLLSDAVSVDGPWTMRWADFEVEATRVFYPEGVTFIATFPEHCWLEPPEDGLLLLLDGEIRGMKRIDHPGDTMFVVRWHVMLDAREPVA